VRLAVPVGVLGCTIGVGKAPYGREGECVPTLLFVEGFRFYFFSREGQEPPHVHVRRGEAEAKLWLQPVRLAFAEGFSPSELRRLRELTFEHQGEFLRRWHEHLGR
jgi:hypothetical protein